MKKKIKRIAIVFFPIQDAGGINTWGELSAKGFRRNGVMPRVFYMTTGNSYKCDPKEKVKRGSRTETIPAKFLSYGGKHLTNSLQVLSEFDAILFLHPSPHPTKSNKALTDIENWMELYRSPILKDKKKIVIFHDANWGKTNPWFSEVADNVDLIFCAQRKFTHSAFVYSSLHSENKIPVKWGYFPLDMKTRDKFKVKKEFIGVMGSQWIQWKGHKQIIPQLDLVKIPFKFYNSGITYYNLRKEGVLQKHLRKDFVFDADWNEESIHDFHGFSSYDDFCKVLASSLISLDGSVRGYTNYTHFEPMLYGSISLVERRVFNDPDSVIPEDCCIVYDLDNFPEVIPRAVNLEKKKLTIAGMKTTLRAAKFIKDFDCKKVIGKLIKEITDIM